MNQPLLKAKVKNNQKMNTYKIITLVCMLSFAFLSNAQQKLQKVSQSIKTEKDVTIDLNTSHTNIVIDTWNKGTVEIEAYVESDELSKDELEEILKNWVVDVDGSNQNVSIRTSGSSLHGNDWNFDFAELEALDALKDLQFNLADLPEMIVLPEMNFDFSEMPVMPALPALPEGMNNIHFDSEKYKKEGEKYLEQWSKEYEEKYGKDFQIKMEAWAKNLENSDYEKKMEAWGEQFGKQFEKNFGKDFEEKMEKWGEAFGEKFGEEFTEKMEKHAAEIEKKAEEIEKQYEKQLLKKEKEIEKRLEEREARALKLKTQAGKQGKVKKTIKIKMPKDAKLKVNVRHGEIKFASVVHDLKANLSHAKLLAANIDGSETSINASYTPVIVTNWNAGELILNYVDNAHLNNVKSLMLSSNSSNISVDHLLGNALIDGSFGDLAINGVGDTFTSLNIILENSDVVIKLPKTDYNLQYFGKHSSLKHPKQSKSNVSTFSDGNASNGKTIVVNAKYSNVIMQ